MEHTHSLHLVWCSGCKMAGRQAKKESQTHYLRANYFAKCHTEPWTGSGNSERTSLEKQMKDFHGDPVLRNPPSNLGDAGSIPGLCEQGQS